MAEEHIDSSLSYESSSIQSIFPIEECLAWEQYQKAPPTGDGVPTWPCERYGHTAVLLDNHMYVFGGCSSAGVFLSDLWRMSLVTRQWVNMKHLCADDGEVWPTGRHFHTSMVYQQWVYVMFGKSNGYMNDMWRFSTDTLKWQRLQKATTVQEETVGPSRRYGHSVVKFKGRAILFGGFDSFGLTCNDLWEYHFDDNCWNPIEYTLGAAPDSLHHSAVVYQGSMFVWGGSGSSSDLFEYRFGTKTWSPVKTSGALPPCVWGHRACVWEDTMYVVGGGDHVMCTAGVYAFSFSNYEWRKVGVADFSSRYFISMVQSQSVLVLFGGKNIHSYSFDEAFRYNLPVTKVVPPDTHLTDFQGILQDIDTADIEFCFQTGPPLHGHRNILFARFPKFRELCEAADALEGESCIQVQIDQYSQRLFSAFLQFCYCNVLPAETLNTEHLFQMVSLSQDYNSPHLRHVVQRVLIERVDIGNVIELLAKCVQLFEQVPKTQLPRLTKRCIRLIVTNFGGLRYTIKVSLPYAYYKDLKSLSEEGGGLSLFSV